MNKDQLTNITREVVRKHYGVTFEVKESKTTNSLYIEFRLEDVTLNLRISDHNNYKYNGTKMTSQQINTKVLKRTIENLCNRLSVVRTKKVLARI